MEVGISRERTLCRASSENVKRQLKAECVTRASAMSQTVNSYDLMPTFRGDSGWHMVLARLLYPWERSPSNDAGDDSAQETLTIGGSQS